MTPSFALREALRAREIFVAWVLWGEAAFDREKRPRVPVGSLLASPSDAPASAAQRLFCCATPPHSARNRALEMDNMRTLKLLALAPFALALACGGGGGDQTPAATPSAGDAADAAASAAPADTSAAAATPPPADTSAAAAAAATPPPADTSAAAAAVDAGAPSTDTTADAGAPKKKGKGKKKKTQ
jgi:hypothetical protein